MIRSAIKNLINGKQLENLFKNCSVERLNLTEFYNSYVDNVEKRNGLYHYLQRNILPFSLWNEIYIMNFNRNVLSSTLASYNDDMIDYDYFVSSNSEPEFIQSLLTFSFDVYNYEFGDHEYILKQTYEKTNTILTNLNISHEPVFSVQDMKEQFLFISKLLPFYSILLPVNWNYNNISVHNIGESFLGNYKNIFKYDAKIELDLFLIEIKNITNYKELDLLYNEIDKIYSELDNCKKQQEEDVLFLLKDI